MKTKIINYEPGSKGDFITNFLNGKISFEKNGQSSASAGTESRVYGQGLINSELDKYVDLLLNSSFKEKYISSHSIIYLTDDLLNKLSEKYNLYHICVDSNWQKQVNIDIIFKVFIKPLHQSLIEKSKKMYGEETASKLKYNIDLQIANTVKNITDQDRIDFVNFFIERNVFFNNKNPLIKQVNYNDLFAEPFDGIAYLMESNNKKFKSSFYKPILQKTFLPKTIDAFGHTFNIEDLGYRYYI